MVHIDDLLPASVFKHHIPIAGKPVGPILDRDPRAGTNHLDLSGFYHVSLQTPWEFRNLPGNDLAKLPQGFVKFDNIEVSFDVRGLIQLKGTTMYPPFPEKIEGIRVNQQGRRIHAIVVTSGREKEGVEVGSFELHYRESPPARLPIHYGQHVLDWWYNPEKRPVTEAAAAWQGVNQMSEKQGRAVWVFYVNFENPHPETPIESLSFHSAMSKSAPFLIAITLD